MYPLVQYGQEATQVMSKSDVKRQAILENAYRLFRAQGFDGTSMADITTEVGGSKATLYSHFPSKEELFVECMMAALENYMPDTLKHLEASRCDPEIALRNFGSSVLKFICSPEQVEVRRLMIAEAARSGTGKRFFDKLSALRSQISSFLNQCMASGQLRSDDPDLAADHLGALLEAEVLEPLLLHVRETAPDEKETAFAARRAVAAFLRAYAPPTAKGRVEPVGHARRLPPHEI
jgi:AcrR family transcriptional regulator